MPTNRPSHPIQFVALFDAAQIAAMVGEEPVLPSCFRKAEGSVSVDLSARSRTTPAATQRSTAPPCPFFTLRVQRPAPEEDAPRVSRR
jgi:hypothetical protein